MTATPTLVPGTASTTTPTTIETERGGTDLEHRLWRLQQMFDGATYIMWDEWDPDTPEHKVWALRMKEHDYSFDPRPEVCAFLEYVPHAKRVDISLGRGKERLFHFSKTELPALVNLLQVIDRAGKQSDTHTLLEMGAAIFPTGAEAEATIPNGRT